jgi:hypothetical protein
MAKKKTSKKTTSKKLKATKKSAKRASPAPQAKRAALGAATDRTKTVNQRIQYLQQLPPEVYNKEDALQAVMKILADATEPLKLRFAALDTLGAAAFSSSAFTACRADYIATLRKIATDQDAEMRRRVLGILTRQKDAYAQQQLVQGLQDPAKALVPPEKALQLLGNDVHSEAYPVAQSIAANPPNPAARREALRFLAGDASYAANFESILSDKNEAPEIRQLSAAALQTTNPEGLRKRGRDILMDSTDNEDVHQTVLTALTNFGGDAVKEDSALVSRVSEMSGPAEKGLQKSARQFVEKYRR